MNRSALISALAELDKKEGWYSFYGRLADAAEVQKKELGLTTKECLKNINFCRNRYQNVFPYDQTRVMLKTLGTGQSDYLNASFLYVPFARRNYILTQGPLDTTTADFWQMVWEQDVQIIAMLNNVFEKGSEKCYPYFVDEKHKTKTFGHFTITLEDEQGTKDYRIRKVKLTALDERFHTDGVSERIINHFHFIDWPDFGVPETSVFLEYLQKINEAQADLPSSKAETPVVVHCSAGIGRSGAYVVVDCVLTYLQNGNVSENQANGDAPEPPKTIEELVLFIRRHRMGLIQTPEQLRFCYQAIVDWINANPEETNEKLAESVQTHEAAVASGEGSTEPDIISPHRKRHSTSESSSIERRKQKIQEMRKKLRQVEQSKNRWWYRLVHDDNTKYVVGCSIAALGAVSALYVYNLYASK